MNIAIMREKKGVTLVELAIVMTIIGILIAIGIPGYGRFIDKSAVRRATSDLLQNMRLARTMAIKENRTYLITFNETANTYRIGIDGGGNGSLLDIATDEYGNGTGVPVRVIDIQTEYGNNIVLGAGNFPIAIVPPNGPNGVATGDMGSFQFLPDSSASPNGIVYLQHTGMSFTYCVELVNAAGLIDLFMWQGDANNTTNTGWTEIR